MSDIPYARKSLGQHWLHDEASLDAMVQAGAITPDDTVVEVGPGLGTLTVKLLEAAKKVIAIELDDELAHGLKGRVEALGLPESIKNDVDSRLEVVRANILEYDFSQITPNYKVVANIPYYLTSNLIRTLLEAKNPPSIMALLVQKEVAERIVAKPGQMSILAVSVQFYAQAEALDLVPAALFTPPPKVDSQIIKLTRRQEPLFPDVDTKQFFKVVKAGFSEKRKKLRSSLSGALHLEKSVVDSLLIRAEISPEARAQELTLEQWYQLYRVIKIQA